MSTFVEIKFKEKFRELGVYNPILYYLEQAGVSLAGYGKISMTDHGIMDYGITRPFKAVSSFKIYSKNHIQNQAYNVKFNYTDMTALLFSSGLLEHVIKERVTSDDLVSKLSTQGAMRAWLGLQDTRCVKGTKAVGCDRNEGGQDGGTNPVCPGVQVHQNEEGVIGNDVCTSGATSDNESLQAV